MLPDRDPFGRPTYFNVPIPNHPATHALRVALARLLSFGATDDDEMVVYIKEQIAMYGECEAEYRQMLLRKLR